MNEGPMDDAPTGRGMLDLPPECLTRVGTLVGSLADMLSLGQVCRALRDCDRDWLWRARVEADFGLRLPPAGSGVKPPKALYIEFHRQRSGRVRFQGCYTDGGCDASARRYWVDNMFQENHWDSYCSEAGSNVHCAGLLLGAGHEGDQQAQAHREYLIERCRRAAEELFMDPVRLETWTTSELDHFFLELYNEFRQRSLIGMLILHGVAHDKRHEEASRMRRTMDWINGRLQTCDTMVCEDAHPRAGASSSAQARPAFLTRTKAPSSHLRLFDTALGELWARPEAGNWVASVDACHISRLGHFSCPVACGAVFLADARQRRIPGGAPALRTRIQAAAAESSCSALDDATQRDDVELAVAQGQLPPIVASGRFAGGEWVEFDPDWTPPGREAMLHPVLWFHFYTQAEVKQRLASDIPAAPSSGAAPPPLQPGLLDAQPAFQIPPGGALAYLMDNHPDSDSDEEGEGGGADNEAAAAAAAAEAPAPEAAPESSNVHKELQIPLSRRHSGNLALVKLISHEDLRSEWQDNHEHPNLDISFVSLHGRCANLMPGAPAPPTPEP
eukprot:jgi/Tetstr1/428891/TSEL_018870.t1